VLSNQEQNSFSPPCEKERRVLVIALRHNTRKEPNWTETVKKNLRHEYNKKTNFIHKKQPNRQLAPVINISNNP